MIPGIVTAILLAAFLGGTAWAFSSRRRAEFEAAARMPLEDVGAASAATEISPQSAITASTQGEPRWQEVQS